ncbi:hypothetical protein BD779DRAFT_1438311 [Infundibulicybe gibba]|nr:hypothetical protein BD779DRAFT_1438311 [Infundibulicybe gibba]
MISSDSIDISKYQIAGHESVFYVPKFLTQEEEDYLIRKIMDTPHPKWKQLANRRLQVWGGEITPKNRLLAQSLPSFIHTYPDIITRLKYTGIFRDSPHGAPNHIIINEYLPGQGIMPHEDGPTYHPVVATISLGSHTVFNYYRYNGDDQAPDATPSLRHERGRVIDPIPIQSVILERRSLVISTGSMYTSYLHGIEAVESDVFSSADGINPPLLTNPGVKIANWALLTDETKSTILEGGILHRGTRYSLTCRDVEHVASPMSYIGRK